MSPVQPPARLALLKADIEAHLSLPQLGAPWLARRYGVTARHIHRLFRQADLSLSGHIAERRLFRACRQLAESGGNGRTIADIAFEVGFGDISYFNRCFQRRFKARPGDLRAAFGTSRAQV